MFDAIGHYINFHWLYMAFMAVCIASTLAIVAVILSENRNPVKSLAWVTVLLLLPGVGLILYLFFGRSIKNKHLVTRRLRRKFKRSERGFKTDTRDYDLTEESRQQIMLGRALSGAIFYPGNEVEVFTDGKSKFEALKADLREARESINLQYYIFEDDNIGREIRDLLIERAAAGVKVRVIYDHVGSFHVNSRFFKDMRRHGIEVYPFFKVSFPAFATRINWRNHRKICVIDGKIGYLGGMNIADRYIDGGKFATWRDTHVRVTGPIVRALHFSFAVDWHFMGRPMIEELQPATGTNLPLMTGAQLLTSGPTSQWSNVAFLFQKAIANAKTRVYLQTPYFLPTEGLLKALQAAALARVDVRVMIPVKSDSRMLTLASASYVSECLQAGIKIYLYEAGMLHSKMLLVDDEFVSIGSTNFDFRSFEHNFESNLFFYSRPLSERMLRVFHEDMANSRRINAIDWHRRPFIRKAMESIVRLLSPIL